MARGNRGGVTPMQHDAGAGARATRGSAPDPARTRRTHRSRVQLLAAGLLLAAAALAVAACGDGSSSDSDSTTSAKSASTSSTATAGASAAPDAKVAAPKLQLTDFGGTFDTPLWVGSPTGDSRVFVLEKPGRVDLVDGATRTVALDISRQVLSTGGEQGLVGMAFHPKFASNGRVFLYYTVAPIGDARLVEYHFANGKLDPKSAKLRLKVPLDKGYQNHNGGGMQFGPDGLLYIGVGDGGSAGDPDNHAQNPKLLMGKLLRLDVDHGTGSKQVPARNHWASGKGGRGEVYAIGLRNPWRFSFDAKTHDLWIGDVGQDKWEEVDHVASPLPAAPNFGWRHFEGTHVFNGGTKVTAGTKVLRPAFQYPHTVGCSVTGGVVYRGTAIPALQGRYLYSDFCKSWIGISTGTSTGTLDDVGVPGIAHIGVDGAGELLAASPQTGKVYRVTA